MRSLLSAVLALCLLGVVSALSATGNRLLVVLDDVADKDKYSQFWGDLQGELVTVYYLLLYRTCTNTIINPARGFTISYETPKSEPALFLHGDRAYDHLLLLPTRLKTLGPSLAPSIILEFVKQSGNLILGLSSNTPTPTTLVSLLLELDIHLSPDRSSLVVDHFNYDVTSASEQHDVLLLTHPDSLRPDVKNYFSGEGVLAFPHTVGQVLGNASPLLAPILKAPSTAYSYNPKEEADSSEEPWATGRQLSLISSMQSRNSARITVVGSAEMLEDAWFDAEVQASGSGDQSEGPKVKTANREFAKKVSGWTFQEVGVLKVGRIAHKLNGGDDEHSPVNATQIEAVSQRVGAAMELNRKIYRIKNDVVCLSCFLPLLSNPFRPSQTNTQHTQTYTIELSEHNWDHLIPFVPASSDALQLEFSMLDPYHRLPLTPTKASTSNSTLFTTTFRIPDQHGIFNFRVNYKRPFLTYIDEKDTVTVRHFAHDEWPRSWAISGAWVWIVGVWGTVAGFCAFVGVWLYSAPVAEEEERRKGKKVQ